MNLLTTSAGSMMEGFLPQGWDLAKIDACCSHPPVSIGARRPWWHHDFEPVACMSLTDFDVMLGHEIAWAIRRTRQQGRTAALILPVGPMGMYRWAVYFLKEWDVTCDHVHGFNMYEWSDCHGATLPAHHPGAFQNAMQSAFYGPLSDRTVPDSQRWFDMPDRLPHYAAQIAELKAGGRADRHLRHRPPLPHRLLGAPLHRRIRLARRVEGPDAPDRRPAAPADHRAERADQLQEPNHARPRLRQHHRPRPVPPGRPDHRRRRRHL
jgi:hypothetical protein